MPAPIECSGNELPALIATLKAQGQRVSTLTIKGTARYVITTSYIQPPQSELTGMLPDRNDPDREGNPIR
jgi:hypothetical protein